MSRARRLAETLTVPKAKRLAHLATLPSVVMTPQDAEDLLDGALAIEERALRRSEDDTRPIGR